MNRIEMTEWLRENTTVESWETGRMELPDQWSWSNYKPEGVYCVTSAQNPNIYIGEVFEVTQELTEEPVDDYLTSILNGYRGGSVSTSEAIRLIKEIM